MGINKGSCNCGQTKVEFDGDLGPVAICHCISCRKSGGSAFSTNTVAEESKIKIDGPTQSYQDKGAKTGNSVERVFCGNCGSPILTKTPYYAPNVALKTSLFPDFADQQLGMELFTKDRSKHLTELHEAQHFEAMN